VALVRLVQPSNTPSPMLVTLLPSVTLVSSTSLSVFLPNTGHGS
jgi:hypothetical protein